MSTHRSLFSPILAIALLACQGTNEPSTEEALYQAHCGGCHMTPAPESLPKAFWEENVLPEMAARLGYRHEGYNPWSRYSMEEGLYIRMTGAYPETTGLDSTTWRQLHDWIISQAPDSIPVDEGRSRRNKPLTRFHAEPISLDTVELATITYIDFLSDQSQFVVGDAFGKVMDIQGNPMGNRQFESPVMTYQPGEETLIAEVGYMNPSDRAWGKVHQVDDTGMQTLIAELKRPVYSQAVDLNGDGTTEILICEYGNYGGQLSMLQSQGTGYMKRTLLPVPGTIRFEIHDMNADGRKDIVVLAAQGNEGLYILYQEEDLAFRPEQVIQLPPEYGSSWFEMVDYDKDGDLDIAYANGDNADYTIFSKPYHGVRLFENSGSNSFEEVWFYPIYGATRVIPNDYDLDGDIDLAVLAFFPDFGAVPTEGFVYLENVNAEDLQFESYTFEGSLDARWLVMDEGDVDRDGDTDLLLGAFMMYPGDEYRQMTDRWIEGGVDLYLLRNNSFSMKAN